MSDQVLIALIVGLPLIITSVGSFVLSYLSRNISAKTAYRLEEVHSQINGKMEELLRARGAEERAAGEAVGREKAITERQDRITEAERVEDRKENKTTKT